MSVYNSDKYLREAVDSVLDQSFSDFEFIIINDGSTDNCRGILRSYTDKRIRLLERENRGLSSSLNEGIAMAMGKYIARMDHDDVSVRDRLQIQYDFMEKRQDIGILGAQAFIIDEKGKLIGSTGNPVGHNAIKKCIEFVCPITHPTYFVRKNVFEDIKGYRNLHSQDYDFLLRAAEKGIKMHNLEEKLLLYRIVQRGMSLSNLQMVIREWALIQKAHRNRMSGKNDTPIFEQIKNIDSESSTWFNFVYGIKQRMSYWKNASTGLHRKILYIAIGAVSLLHYQLFLYEYCHFRSKLISRRY